MAKRVGFAAAPVAPGAGRVRTRMSRNETAKPKAGPALPISTSRSFSAANRIATSLARS